MSRRSAYAPIATGCATGFVFSVALSSRVFWPGFKCIVAAKKVWGSDGRSEWSLIGVPIGSDICGNQFQGESNAKKSVIAVLTVAVGLLLSSIPLFAQDANAGPNTAIDRDIELFREDVRSERKQLVAANLPLTATEATKFWPIYDQYAAEVWKIGHARVALIKEYVQSYDTMTDAQANDFMNRSAAIDQQFSALLTKYVPIFEKVISPQEDCKVVSNRPPPEFADQRAVGRKHSASGCKQVNVTQTCYRSGVSASAL